MIYKTARAKYEAIELVSRIQFLNTVEETRNNVVSTRSLTTGKYYADINLSCLHSTVCRFKLQVWHTISVWKQFLYFFLISY